MSYKFFNGPDMDNQNYGGYPGAGNQNYANPSPVPQTEFMKAYYNFKKSGYWDDSYGKPDNGSANNAFGVPFTFGSAPAPDWNTKNVMPDSNIGNTVMGVPAQTLNSPTDNSAPKPVIDCSKSTFFYDFVKNSMVKEEVSSSGKIKRIEISEGFSINCVYINVLPDNTPKSVTLTINKNGINSMITIPYDDFINKRFGQLLSVIHTYPGVTKTMFNSMIDSIIYLLPKNMVFIFEHQGINELLDGTKVFVANNYPFYMRTELKTKSVECRKIADLSLNPIDIVESWIRIFMSDPVLAFLGLYHICSLFCHMFAEIGLTIHEFLIVGASKDFSENEAAAILATNDIEAFPVANLESSVDIVNGEIKLVKDGVVFFKDHSFVDQKAKNEEKLRHLIRYRRNDLNDLDPARNLLAVYSDNAGFIAPKIAPDNVIYVPTEGVKLSVDTTLLRNTVELMDSWVISIMLRNYDSIIKLFLDKLLAMQRIDYKIGDKPMKDTLKAMIMVESFCKTYLNISVIDNKENRKFILELNDSSNLMNASQAIVRDFANKLSVAVRSDILTFVKKTKNMFFDNDYQTLLIEGERMYIPSEVINDILSKMKITHNFDMLINAFKHTDNLVATDGNTHPIELHNSMGEVQRYYLYDLSIRILDADVLFRAMNVDSEKFMLDEDVIPHQDFVPLIKDIQDRTAGKLVRYDDVENNHIYITGQSGYGKTYLMHHLAAKYHAIGNTIVVFDSSNSFTPEGMSRNLSPDFVSKYVRFHDLDKQAIPVNLFRVDCDLGLNSQKKELLGIITAAIGDLTTSQSNLLRTVLTDLLGNSGGNNTVSIEKLIERLKNKEKRGSEKGTAQSLISRLNPLCEDIKACGMADDTWDNVLGDRSKIVVFHTNSAYTESGDQIIDMLMARLFNYQSKHSNIPVNVFIDEIQNQNFSTDGPIRKIMKEGRKIHLAFAGATQEYYSRSTDIGKTMSKADTQIFLKPTPDSAGLVAEELRYTKADLAKFDSMERGDIIVKGALYSKKERRNIAVTLTGHLEDYTSNDIRQEDESDNGADDNHIDNSAHYSPDII